MTRTREAMYYWLPRLLGMYMVALNGEIAECLQNPRALTYHAPTQPWGAPTGARLETTFLHSTTVPASSESSGTMPDEEASGKTESSSNDESMPQTAKEQVSPENFPQHSKQRPMDQLSMPWSEVQDWALRDNLAKYTIMIPLETAMKYGSNDEAKDSSASGTMAFALWRTMLKEVPELAGYPIEFLMEVHDRQIANNETRMQVTPQLLPYLEDYTFATAGGVSGKVYGVPGLADGTRIETSAVANIEVTLPQGFVRTSDGKAAYELGRPQREEFSDVAMSKEVQQAKNSIGSVKKGSYELLNTVNVADTVDIEGADGMLVRLGASTGIILAGATAINMLSHHMTVNVFWV